MEGFDVLKAPDLKSDFRKLESKDIDVILSDVKLPNSNGVEFIQKVKASFPFTEVVLLTAYGKISDGAQAMKNGAFDYIVKDDDNDKLFRFCTMLWKKYNCKGKLNSSKNEFLINILFIPLAENQKDWNE